MANGLLFPIAVGKDEPLRRKPRWIEFHRRGPILRPSASNQADQGVFGIDLTAGCALGCPFCHVPAAPWYPGPNRVLFDPSTARRLAWELDEMPRPPRLVVLSPSSDPLAPKREVQAQARQVIETLVARRINVLLMTRGRISRPMVSDLARHADTVRVAVGLLSLDRALSRILEPAAAPPRVRIGRLERLVAAGVPVEVRLEPMIPGLTDTQENVRPLFRALERAGVRKVVAHYLFQHSAMTHALREALGPTGLAEKLEDAFQGGPVFSVGSLGTTKHLPLDVRQEGLARFRAWGAEQGLLIETGSAQNPDMRRDGRLDFELRAAGPPTPRPVATRPNGSGRVA